MPMYVIVTGPNRVSKCSNACPNKAVGLWSPEWVENLATTDAVLLPRCASCSVDLLLEELSRAQDSALHVAEFKDDMLKRESFLGGHTVIGALKFHPGEFYSEIDPRDKSTILEHQLNKVRNMNDEPLHDIGPDATSHENQPPKETGFMTPNPIGFKTGQRERQR